MKKLLLFISLILVQFALLAQKDINLERRLAEFMQANDPMDLEKVLDYTYPKLYTVVPRDQMLEAMQNVFDNDKVSIKLESLRIDAVYPVFKMQNGSYAKVIYSFNMLMTFKDAEEDSLSSEKKKEKNDAILAAMASQYGEDKVSLDPATGILKIQVTSPMVAVKDQYAKQWSFVNLKENDPLTDSLFSKEILKKLASYK